MEFNVGDRVKIIHDETFCGISYKDCMGVVLSIDMGDPEGYPYKLQIDGLVDSYWVGPNDIEKIQEENTGE